MEIQELEELMQKKQILSKSQSLIKRRSKKELKEVCAFDDNKNELHINFTSINKSIESYLMIMKLLGMKVIIYALETDKNDEYLIKLNMLFNVQYQIKL